MAPGIRSKAEEGYCYTQGGYCRLAEKLTKGSCVKDMVPIWWALILIQLDPEGSDLINQWIP